MRPIFHSPYFLYKKPLKNSSIPMWYARFWDESAGRYTVTRSTGILAEGKRERHSEADAVAKQILEGLAIETETGQMLFLDFLLDFWREDSAYATERALVYKQPLSREYIKTARGQIKLHFAPYPKLRGMTLEKVTPAFIRDWMIWGAAKGMSGKGINTIFEAMRVAVRWAYMREEIPKNPFGQIKKAYHKSKERGVLTAKEAARVMQLGTDDANHALAVQLAMFCGMRCGEVRGLLWGDIDFEECVINIEHNYVLLDGMKAPKAGSNRRVPLPEAVKAMLEYIRSVSMWTDSDDFVFCQPDARKTARGQHFFRYSVEVVLRDIGIPVEDQKKRNLVFHSLRHTFVTLGRLSGLSDMVIMNLAGHKTSAMMERYSHAGQVIDFAEAKKRLESIANQDSVSASER